MKGMAVVSQALCILRGDEGVRRHAYDDATGERVRAPKGNLTIGVGINLDAGLDDMEIDWLERHRVHVRRLALSHLLMGMALAEGRGINLDALPEDADLALTLMAFQLGPERVCGFRKMLAAIGSGDWSTAADEALASKWDAQTAPRAERVAKLLRGCAK